MKIALIGATGFVGSHILGEALARGHQVTAVMRNPDRLKRQDPNLTLCVGDILDAGSVAHMVRGHDAVVSAYNPGWDNPRIYDEFMAGARQIQLGAKEAGVRRFLVIGGAGSLRLSDGTQLVDSPTFPSEFLDGARAARDYLSILLNETTLDWTFLSPAIHVTDGLREGRKGRYRVAEDEPVYDEQGKSRISVQDLAVAVLDELEHPSFIRKRFTVGY